MLTLIFAFAFASQIPAGPTDLSADFAVPAGLSVTLWAEAPMFFNPTAMDVDTRGRIWVTEAVNYRKWRGRNPGLAHPQGDRVVILEDTDGDGDADKSSVFVQDKDLVAPLGICVIDDHRALVSCSPHAFIYTDTDGDGKADKRETFLTGFGGGDHDHGLHSFVIGPDGNYYVAVGNAGPHIVTDRDGFTLRSGSLYNDGGEFVADNKPGLVSDDGRVWVGGLVLRFHPDGGGLSVRAHNFRNNYEVAIDSYGEMYGSDNDDDGNQGCRAQWILPRSNNGYFSSDGSRYWNADRRPGQDTQRAHWHQDDPGVAPAGTITGAGGPTGVAMIEGDSLGKDFDGWMLAADAGARVVFGMSPIENGSRIDLTTQRFLAPVEREGDGGRSHWFRPSDVLIGTDGATYVSDWYDPGVGGHAMGDKEGYGRILRVARTGSKTGAPKIDLKTAEGRVSALSSPANNIRGRAARELLAHPDEILELNLRDGAADPRTAARLQWVRSSLVAGGPPRPARNRMLEDLLLCEGLIGDAIPQVLLRLCDAYDGSDRTYLEALGIAARGRESELYGLLVAKQADPLQWDAVMSNLAWRLHPAEAVPAIKSRAMSGALSLQLRKQAIDTLAFTMDRSAGEAMLDVALAGPEDAREYARWWIKHRDTNDWSAWNLDSQIEGGNRANAKLLFESPIMKDGSAKVDVDLAGATRLYLSVDDGGNGNSCDWANWVDGMFSGPGGEVALGDLPWSEANAAWGQVRRNKNCDNGPLIVAGVTHANGIGTHANSEIGFVLPPDKIDRLRVTVGPDQKGVNQGGGTSIRFRVFAEIPPDPTRYTGVEARLMDTKLGASERKQAAEQLCSTREGGLFVLAGAEKGRYDGDSKLLLAGAIFGNPDLSVRALASEHFQRGAVQMPSITALEKLHGDEKNGELVFFGAAANCAQCHVFAGRGGDTGPDLTQLRQKNASSAIFDAILNPSAGIAFGYDTWMLETDDDRVLSGFILADGERVIVKDSSGVRTMLEAAEIVSRRKAKVSAMPDNISAGLSPQELADVVAFLRSDREAPRKLGPEVDLLAGEPFDAWTFFLDKPNAKLGDVWSLKDGVLDCKGQPIGYIYTKDTFEDFVLELDWRFPEGGEPGNSGVLLRRVGPHRVWPKSAEAQLQHRSAGDIWNIDDVPMVVDKSRTSGRRTQKLAPCNELPQGQWNHYRITLDRGNLTLEVNGIVQNSATWVERVAGNLCLQSEGSRIQFRNIILRRFE